MEEEFKPYKEDNFGKHYKHPTFGVIQFSRCQGGDNVLFGSSIKHNDTIRLTVSHAELHRDLHRDWIHEREAIVEVSMSPTQFADAITSLNVGGGVPVTIRYIAGGEHENLYHVSPPYQNKVDQFKSEFKETANDLIKHIDDTIKMAEESHVPKKVIRELDNLKMWFNGNLPFVSTQFTEQMEKTVTEAKGAVDAFVQHTIQSYGIEAIRQNAPKLAEVNQLAITEGKPDET